MSERSPQSQAMPRMAPLARLPVFFALEGKRAIVTGDGPGIAWKVELLEATGARVDRNEQPTWTPDHFAGAAIAVGSFEDDERARDFADAARKAGVPVNVVDKPALSNFSFGAIVNRSPLVIAVSTDGAAPVFAQAIRARIEALLPMGFAGWADAARRWRPQVKALGDAFRGRRFWETFTERAFRSPNTAPDMNQIIGAFGAHEGGSVTLVGAGPGDAELLTLRAVRALQSADVILFDDLVSHDVLDFARREAKKILVGKTGHGPACKQTEINDLMIKLAGAGRRVVRLKGGDPLVFGRAGEEIAACQAAGIPVDVVPGISAAQGAAARLGVSLTQRGQARRVQFITGHDEHGRLPKDLDWESLADPNVTTAIYMPRKTLAEAMESAISHGLSPETPAIAIANATRPGEVTVTGVAADIAGKLRSDVKGPVLVLVGRVFGRVPVEVSTDIDVATTA